MNRREIIVITILMSIMIVLNCIVYGPIGILIAISIPVVGIGIGIALMIWTKKGDK